MKTLITSITIMLIILSGIIAFLIMNILDSNITGNSIIREYTYTQAICNENQCQDYIIVCQGNTLLSKTPITGAIVDIDSNFNDPRDLKTINNFCQIYS